MKEKKASKNQKQQNLPVLDVDSRRSHVVTCVCMRQTLFFDRNLIMIFNDLMNNNSYLFKKKTQIRVFCKFNPLFHDKNKKLELR